MKILLDAKISKERGAQVTKVKVGVRFVSQTRRSLPQSRKYYYYIMQPRCRNSLRLPGSMCEKNQKIVSLPGECETGLLGGLQSKTMANSQRPMQNIREQTKAANWFSNFKIL